MITFKDFLDTITSAGTVIAAFAAVAAARSANSSAKTAAEQLEDQVARQEMISRPRLVPLNTQLRTQVVTIFDDWIHNYTEKLEFDVVERPTINKDFNISSFPIEVVNTGTSFAKNISYYYEIEGGISALREYENSGKKLSLVNTDFAQIEPHRFSFDIEVSQDYRGMLIAPLQKTMTLKVKKTVYFLPLMQSNEKSPFTIPAYFVAISNLYLKRRRNEDTETIVRPKVRLKISYEDQYNNKYTDIYRMQLADKPMMRSGWEDQEILAWIFFEFISSTQTTKKPTREGRL